MSFEILKGFRPLQEDMGPMMFKNNILSYEMFVSNFCFEWGGAILDILRKPQKANRKAALYRGGSLRRSE